MLTKVVARALPFQRTTELPLKLLPLTVIVKPASPATLADGVMLVIEGAGFWTDNELPAEVPPPGAGLKTVIDTVPVARMSVANNCAVNCVALTKIVVRFAPFTRTTAPLTKPPPLTVNVNAGPPTVTDDGVKPLIEGSGFPTENETDVEVPPPGVGFVTVTG